MTIATGIYRFRVLIVLAWVLAAGCLIALVPATDVSGTEPASFLPPGMPSVRAGEAFQKFFPANSGLSEAVIVFERTGRALDTADRAAIEKLARQLRDDSRNQKDMAGARVLSPGDMAARVKIKDVAGALVRSPGDFLLLLQEQNPLISEDHQAALVKINVPASFVTIHSARVVDHIRQVLRQTPLPAGLEAAVTGTSGFGRDYVLAAERSNERALLVTVAAVIVILLVVYRAPIAAMIPLAGSSLAAVVTMHLLQLAQRFGMHVGTAERIFVVVLLYGAAVDYSLLLLSRYRENLDAGSPPSAALPGALHATLPAILAAGGSNTAGLLMLCFAQFSVFRTTGPAVAVALVTALLAAVTLVPALTGIVGQRLFWPSRKMGTIGRKNLWPKVAGLVTKRPGWVMVVVLVALVAPAVQGSTLTWVYDTMAALSSEYGARRGIEAAKRHWPVGEIGPVRILVQVEKPLPAETWQDKAQALTAALSRLSDVRNVRSLQAPLGTQAGEAANALARRLGRKEVLGEYLGAEGRAIRLEAVLSNRPFSLAAMDDVRSIRRALSAAARAAGLDAEFHIAGASAEMIDLRDVTQRDFYRIGALTLGVIFLIVLVLLRDAILTAFMMASTVLSYLATLGIAYWLFAGVLGQGGLDWKVEVFLFVVMVAVGVDYNIFLAARMAQESAGRSLEEAARRAIVQTGPVISSAGIIMAASLGSLAVGDLLLLQQLGFALALGMLIDTFVVRPLLLPAFAILTRRAGRAPSLGH